LDPGVLVSALISPEGPPRQVVTAWAEGRFELIVSPILLEELRDVLTRVKFRRWVSIETAAEFIDGLEDSALSIDDPAAHAGLSLDPDDDYLVALARSSGADHLVSGDSHLTSLAGAKPVVLTPREFLERLSQPNG
jgi:putative PIN family toxin of toxin-antitoxin system